MTLIRFLANAALYLLHVCVLWPARRWLRGGRDG
jgi:hypothetical protein